MNKDTQPLMVTIKCFTYNQEQYIRQCLDGFVMQKTNFRFEAIVHDDASTDGTADIIREYEAKYPDIIKPIYETENQYSKHDGSLERIIKEHTHGKYIAVCEGDDYWIDPLKLQKQVDFLESNPDYGLVYTNHYNRKGLSEMLEPFEEKGYENFNQFVISSGIGTLTACYRKDIYNQYIREVDPLSKGWLMGDAPLWKYISYNSKVKFLSDYTSVYRILKESASHSNNSERQVAFVNSGYDIQRYFIERYVSDEKSKQKYLTISLRKKIIAIFGIFYANGDLRALRNYMKGNWASLNRKYWFILRVKEFLLQIGIK